jgi:hypothetical protein
VIIFINFDYGCNIENYKDISKLDAKKFCGGSKVNEDAPAIQQRLWD